MCQSSDAYQSKDAHYARLNDRFKGRSARLRALGFRYERVPGYEAAVFVKPRPGQPVPATIQASYVMHADDFCWSERIAEIERFGY